MTGAMTLAMHGAKSVTAESIATGYCSKLAGLNDGGIGVELVRTCQPYSELAQPVRKIDSNSNATPAVDLEHSCLIS
jgi:hypothetical protein